MCLLNASFEKWFHNATTQFLLQNWQPWCLLGWYGAWLGKSPTCRQHVGPTVKSQHIWTTGPQRADTNLFPTHFFVSGIADFLQIFSSTRGTYGVIIVQTGMYNIKQFVQPGYYFAPLTYYSLDAQIFFSASIIEKQHLTTLHLTTSAAAA